MKKRTKAEILKDIRNLRATESNYTKKIVRADPYKLVADRMLELVPDSEIFADMTPKEVRTYCKDPLMTALYNSKAEPEKAFGEETQELEAFYQTLNELFPGAMNVLEALNNRWDDSALYHEFRTPDDHIAHVKVMPKVKGHLKTQGLELEYTFKSNEPSEVGTSLAPNFIHGAGDGFLVRYVITKAKEEGFTVVHIHDQFDSHPNNMKRVSELYLEGMAIVAESRVLEEFCQEDFGIELDDLLRGMKQAKYALC